MDEFAELIRREFEEIKARALNGVIERIRLHQQNEKSCYL